MLLSQFSNYEIERWKSLFFIWELSTAVQLYNKVSLVSMAIGNNWCITVIFINPKKKKINWKFLCQFLGIVCFLSVHNVQIYSLNTLTDLTRWIKHAGFCCILKKMGISCPTTKSFMRDLMKNISWNKIYCYLKFRLHWIWDLYSIGIFIFFINE